MATRKAAPKLGEALIVALSPDVCKSPDDPVPYQTFAKYSQQVKVSGNVFINGVPACNKNSRTSGVKGNGGGSGGGVKSGVHMGGGWARPDSDQAPGLHINGAECLRHDDIHLLNCAGPEGPANTKGKTVYGAGGSPQAGVAPDGTIAGDTNPALTENPSPLDSSSSVSSGDMDVSETLGSAGNEVGAAGGSSSLGSSLFGGDLASAVTKTAMSPAFINTAAKFAASGGDPKALMGLVGPLLGAAGISSPLMGPAVSMLGGVVNGQNPLLAAAGAVLQGAGVPGYISGPAMSYINQAISGDSGSTGGAAPSQQNASAQNPAAPSPAAQPSSEQSATYLAGDPSGSSSATPQGTLPGDGLQAERESALPWDHATPAAETSSQLAAAASGSASAAPQQTLAIDASQGDGSEAADGGSGSSEHLLGQA